MCWRSATTGGQRQSDWGDMVPRRALQKLGGNVLVSPEEPTCLASVGEFPLSQELRERSLDAPNIQHTAELLALAARAGWVRGDAAALTRAGRRLFRLAGAGGPLLEGGGTIAGEAEATQALAREVLALGDLAAGRVGPPPAGMTLPWAGDLALWLAPCLVFFFSSRRRHTRSLRDWSSDVCSSDLVQVKYGTGATTGGALTGILWG